MALPTSNKLLGPACWTKQQSATTAGITMLDNYTVSKQFFISHLYGKNYYLGWIPTTQTAWETGIHREHDYHIYSGEQLLPVGISKAEGALLPSHVQKTEIHRCSWLQQQRKHLLPKMAQTSHSSRNWNLDLMFWLLQHFPHAWGWEVYAGLATFKAICERSFIASCKHNPRACLIFSL